MAYMGPSSGFALEINAYWSKEGRGNQCFKAPYLYVLNLDRNL